MMMEATKEPTTAPKWIAYYRVSTKRQGLGLEAQKSRVEAAAKEAGAEIIDEVHEKESGKENNRPGLNLAMAKARKHGATIAVAKHDRLSRDISFAAELVFKTGVEFNILNLPPESMSDHLLFSVYYGMAAREAQLTSERTAAALAELKAKGIKLGRPESVQMQIMKERFMELAKLAKPTATEKELNAEVKRMSQEDVDYQELARICCPDSMRNAAYEQTRKKADEDPNNVAAANEIKRYLRDHADRKERSLQRIADHLTDGGYYTSQGVFHTPKSVSLLCKRYGIER